MKKKIMILTAFLGVLIVMFIKPNESLAVNAQILWGQSSVDERVGKQGGNKLRVTFDDSIIYCQATKSGYMGWSFATGQTIAMENAGNLEDVEVIVSIRNKSTNAIYNSYEWTGSQIGWNLDNEVWWVSYDTPAAKNSYYIESRHRVKEKGTGKWYSFYQRRELLYSNQPYNWNSGGFVEE